MSNYLAFVISESSRAKLLETFPPKYPRQICHHVTLKFDLSKGLTDEEKSFLDKKATVIVLGTVDDGNGVQCLPVEFKGKTIRPDGSFYHITHSLEFGRKPVESNKLNGIDFVQDRITVDGIICMVKK